MSQDPVQPTHRALSGLPPRGGRPANGVARLIRSNRDDRATNTDTATGPAVGTTATGDRPATNDHVVPDSQTQAVPKYLQLVRREARMHSRQVSALSDLTRTLNEARRRGARSGVGERITDNTLVRVAVDLLLLQDPRRLHGTTEDELRASVGLPPLGHDRP